MRYHFGLRSLSRKDAKTISIFEDGPTINRSSQPRIHVLRLTDRPSKTGIFTDAMNKE